MNAIPNTPRWVTLGLAFPIIFLNLWLILLLCNAIKPVPSIAITAGLIAFLLNYPIGFLERNGIQRIWAIACVILAAIVTVGVISLFLGPIVLQQLIELANRLPVWFDSAKTQLQALDEQTLFQYLPVDLGSVTAQITGQISTAVKSLTSQLINFTLDTINSAVNFLITLILVILLVLNGQTLWTGLLSWLSPAWQTRLQSSIQLSFQGYFVGQAILATILSVALSLAFLLLNIPFGLLFGLGIGLASAIPFGGTIAILLVSGILASQSIWLGLKVFIVALALGQINDNIIAPRLISGITGLNPTWVVLSLLIGAKLAGLLGLVLAVPTASSIKKITDSVRGEPATKALP